MHEPVKRCSDLSRCGTVICRYVAGAAAWLMAGGSVFGEPAAPTGLTAASVSESRIDLAWADHSSDETGFRVQHSVDGNCWTVTNTAGPNATSAVVTGLAAARKHYFRVCATGAAGDSAWSNTADDNTPEAPNIARTGTGSPTTINDGDLSTSVGWSTSFPRSVFVTWAAARTFNKVVFTIERVGGWQLRDGDGNMIDSGTYNLAAKGTVVRTLAIPSTSSKLELVIVGRSAGSAGAQAARVYELEAYQIGAPRPAMPKALTATACSWEARIGLAWTDASTNETGYKVDASADGLSWRTITNLAANATACPVSGVAPGTAYYRVRACNDSGDSDDSNVAGATTYPPPNLAFAATGSLPVINDGDFTTRTGWYDGFPRSLVLQWAAPQTLDTVVLTLERVSTWDVKDGEGVIVASGTYNLAAKGVQAVSFDPVTTPQLEVVINGRSPGSSGGQAASVYEIEVYAPPPAPPAGTVILIR